MNKIKTLILSAAVGLTSVSCEDFLTLMPLNDVVLENFWTDKSDVESVLLGTYAALENSNCIFRMYFWGEMRSENMVATNGNTSNELAQVLKDNIMETSDNAKWLCFYNVINRANTVLHYAPIVQKKDPNYTVPELNANIAEAVALRSLSYWYLIRAYRDVPYTTQPSLTDEVEFKLPVTPFDVILDSLITDLEQVKNLAYNKYPQELANTSRITRVAIYSMLADMYLWKGDYENCIKNAELVIDRKKYEYKELTQKQNSKNIEIAEYGRFPLLTESGNSEVLSSNTLGYAYSAIFGTGNSFEGIFELYKGASNFNNSHFIHSNNGNVNLGDIAPYEELAKTPKGSDNYLFTETDCRFFESIYSADNGQTVGIAKNAASSLRFTIQNGIASQVTTSVSDQRDANFVVYRFTDVILMEAEAKVMLAKQYDDAINDTVNQLADESRGDYLSQRERYLREAFANVSAVNHRANPTRTASDSIKYNAYNSVEKMQELVLDERHRELIFEGKRWFDLVRISLREGNTKKLSSYVNKKHSGRNATFGTKVTDMNYIFFPIFKDELKVNTLLKQNPAFIEDEFIDKNR